MELTKELDELNGGRYHDDGTPKTFDELEIETNALTDLLSSMALNQSPKDLPEEEKPVRCPQCKAVPKPNDPDDDEPMVIQSARGEVQWMNQGYYCQRCRRSFFPSAG